MRKYLSYTVCICLLFAHKPASAQTTMFLQNAEHLTSSTAASVVPFNEVEWKFPSGAPIRSTVAYFNNSLFFGNSQGVFYALDKNSGIVKWKFSAHSPIHSSAAVDNGNVFFSDNKQELHSLNMTTGRENWVFKLGQSKHYEWAFDFLYSSPTIMDKQVLIGSKDGNVYDINEITGKVNWKFRTEGIVRGTPAVVANMVYVGDSEGNVFAINRLTGKQVWRFETIGHSLNNVKFGFDRRAVIASPVVFDNKVIVGGRDGFLYAIDEMTGRQVWRVDHEISWVVSAVAIKNNFVITGTSDGHFVQAVDLRTGKQIWKHKTANAVWSSPLIDGDKVYAGSHDGSLYCLDLKTGNEIQRFQTSGIILSSPVISGGLLFIASDDGFLYALRPNKLQANPPRLAQKFVFFDPSIQTLTGGLDVRIKENLEKNGFIVLDKTRLSAKLKQSSTAVNSVIVFATNYFPPEITARKYQSPIRSYLNSGGRIVVVGNNPLILTLDPKTRKVNFNSFTYPDSVINVKYGPDDTRAFAGNYPAFPTEAGKQRGLKKFWIAPLALSPNQVDVVLGTDENGLASAWIKRFNPDKASGFIQIWADEHDTDLNYITRVAEFGLK